MTRKHIPLPSTASLFLVLCSVVGLLSCQAPLAAPSDSALTPTIAPTPNVARASTPVPQSSAGTSVNPATPPSRDSTQKAPIRLPEDDASHPTDIEWWYFNGHLKAEDGSRYGFHYVFFKVGASDVYFLLGQLAVTDQQRGAFSFDQRFGGIGQQPGQGFEATARDWQMRGFNGEFQLNGSSQSYAFDLRTSTAKPPVPHGSDGLVDFLIAGTSAYYSYTRLDISGSVQDSGVAKRVSGIGWMDHQWGDLQTKRVGWDWFSLQLDDGSDIMFSVVRDSAGSTFLRYGIYVDAEGDVAPIASQEVAIHPLGTWRSPITDIQYPSGWRMAIDKLGLTLDLTPVIPNAEFHTFDRNTPPYWEGEVTIAGDSRGSPITGLGFVELVGYSP